jgi:glutathione S-transferase
MITVHHLNDSRSQRILWLLEELDLPYEIKSYQRDPQSRLAPPELKSAYPLGKSPVIDDDGRTVHESGAIIDYTIRRHGSGRLQPPPQSPAYDEYVQWLHYAEGSAMLPLLLHLYVSRLGDAGAPLRSRIESELANHLGYLDSSLGGKQFLMGAEFTAADVQMSFVAELAQAFGMLAPYKNLEAWIQRLHVRPAYRRALEKGGTYRYAK